MANRRQRSKKARRADRSAAYQRLVRAERGRKNLSAGVRTEMAGNQDYLLGIGQ